MPSSNNKQKPPYFNECCKDRAMLEVELGLELDLGNWGLQQGQIG